MSETVAACLTPPGTAAIAVIGLRGPQAWTLAHRRFRPVRGSLPEQPVPGRYWFGHLGSTGEGPADEGLLVVPPGGVGQTIEWHCHGGVEVVRWLLAGLAREGCRVVDWSEYLHAEEPSPLRRLARTELAKAPTLRTAAILLDQFHGAFEYELRRLAATFDRDRLIALTRWAEVGRHLVKPWQVVLAGPPNVGKSSLMNALAGYARSVVADVPGTTRDVVSTPIALHGWPIELADTAGLRDTVDDLERSGIRGAQRMLAGADLVLWMHDATTMPSPPLPVPVARHLMIVNKTDQQAVWEWSMIPGALAISATSGSGLDALTSAIVRVLVPEAPPPGCAIPFTPGLADTMTTAAAAEDVEAIRILAALANSATPAE